MDVGAAFVAESQAPEAVQPGQSPFDDPAQDTETAAVRTARLGHDGDDSLGRQTGMAGRGPVGAITLDDAGFAPRATAPTRHGRQRGDQRFQLRDISHSRR